MAIEIDLHSHLKASKYIRFDISSYRKTIHQAIKQGLDGYAITEHFHAPDYWDAMARMCAEYPYRDGRLQVDRNLTILTGAEIDVAEGGHILTIGPMDSLHWLDRQFSPTLNHGFRPSASELIRTARHVDLVLIGAHPTRESKYLAGVAMDTLGRLDALEINAKDVADCGDTAWVFAAAEELELATVGSSDAHVWAQIGVQRTLLEIEQFTVQNLRDGLLNRKPSTICTSPNLRATVTMAKRHKTVTKLAVKSGGLQLAPYYGEFPPAAGVLAASPGAV